jgi:SAM-dependent methyltransferase
MPPPDLGDIPEPLRTPILACSRGEMSPNLALMHLCIAAQDAASVARAVDASGLDQLASLWRSKPGAFDLVKAVISTDSAKASQDESLQACAATFDAAAALSPEASVALYSLGDGELLAAATAEIVAAMQSWGLLANAPVVLEIGCGNGRFLEALSPLVSQAIGLDISSAMISAAKSRCAALPNVQVHQTNGTDLTAAEDASIDLVLAIDSFPYIVRCGAALVSRHFVEAKRVLRPGGGLLIVNYSYRGNAELDRRDVAENARDAVLAVLWNTAGAFRLWDGVAYLLEKPVT